MELEVAGNWLNVSTYADPSAGPDDPAFTFGPSRDSLYVVIPITVIYVLIFASGLFGNICTCIVITRNKSLHTATNYYLFSLAVSDLLLLVAGLPQEMYWIWSKWPYVFGETFCVLRGLAAETSTNASVLTISSFTVERYVAICHPFLSHTMSKLSRAIKHILLVWLISFAFALPQALQFGLREHRGVTMCLQTKVIFEHSFEISSFLFFFSPMVLITVLYALIGLRLSKSRIKLNRKAGRRRQRLNGTGSAGAVGAAIVASDATSVGAVALLAPRSVIKVHNKHGQSTKRVIKMLVAVVVAFFICWAPFHAQRLVAIYGTSSNHQARSPTMLLLYATVTYFSGVLYYLSTAINPVLYHIMSNKFRDAFKNTLVGCCRRRGGRSDRRRTTYCGGGVAVSRDPDTPNSAAHTNSGNSVRDETTRFSHAALKSQNSNRSILAKTSSRSLYGPDAAAIDDDDYPRPIPQSPNSDLKRVLQGLYRPQMSKLGRDIGEPAVAPEASQLDATVALTPGGGEERGSLQGTISNSSLREAERRDLQCELDSYMDELRRRPLGIK